jgi:hypothetical protein
MMSKGTGVDRKFSGWGLVGEGELNVFRVRVSRRGWIEYIQGEGL